MNSTVVIVTGGVAETLRGHAEILDLDILDADGRDADVVTEVIELWERADSLELLSELPQLTRWLEQSDAAVFDEEMGWVPA